MNEKEWKKMLVKLQVFLAKKATASVNKEYFVQK